MPYCRVRSALCISAKMATNFSHFPLNPRALPYNNCAVAAEWAATYWRTYDLSLNSTARFLQDGLLDHFKTNNMSGPDDSEVMGWILSKSQEQQSGVWKDMNSFTYNRCKNDVCPKLGWKGNSDLAGRGVRICSIMCKPILTS